MPEQPPDIRRFDQAARLRELMAGTGPEDRALTVAVTSGKGGVGKSNIAVNLAAYLAGRGLRVALIDVDLGLANAELLLGLRCAYNLSHVMSGARRIEEIEEEASGPFRFLAGASGVERLADVTEFERERLVAQTRALERDNDLLILDCAAGISRNVIAFACAADVVLVITTPEPTAIADAYAIIKILTRERCTIHLVVNQAISRAEARATYQRIAEVAEKFLNYPIADGGYLLQDRHVELAVRQRSPFAVRYPHCPASACIGAVASRLARPRVSSRGEGYFRRVVGLFV